MKGFRSRVLGPLALPVGVVVVIVAVVFNFSRILLALEERQSASLATAIAVGVATVVLLGAAFFAFRLQGRETGMMILSAAVVVLVFAGGFGWGLTRVGEGEAEVAGGEGEVAAAPAGGTVDIVATDPFTFEPQEASVPAGEVTVNLKNEGAIVHTFLFEAVPDFEKLIASGTRRQAPGGEGPTATGTVTLQPGKYVFFCDERGHRGAGMEGVLTVTEGGGAGGGAAAPATATADVVATDPFEFKPKELSVPAGEVTVNLKNEGAIVHTLMFEAVPDFEKLIASGTRREAPGQGLTDSGTVTLEPGEYVFFCDERGHRGAGMEGVLTVTEGGAAGAAPQEAASGATADVIAKDPFEYEPKELTVSAGEVTVNLTNEGAIVHTLLFEGVDGFDKLIVSGTRREAPGQGLTDSGTVTLEPGEYVFFCDERGHRGAGMEGTLTVT